MRRFVDVRRSSSTQCPPGEHFVVRGPSENQCRRIVHGEHLPHGRSTSHLLKCHIHYKQIGFVCLRQFDHSLWLRRCPNHGKRRLQDSLEALKY